MRKWLCIVILCGLLTGCAAPTFETLGDVQHEQAMAPEAKSIHLSLPGDAAAEAVTASYAAYDCGNYAVWSQTLPSGDFGATCKALSGFTRDNLTVMESSQDGYQRFDWTWTAAGESGDLVFRAAVIDDGDHHYCVSTAAAAKDMAALQTQWNALFASFAVQ